MNGELRIGHGKVAKRPVLQGIFNIAAMVLLGYGKTFFLWKGAALPAVIDSAIGGSDREAPWR